MQVAKTGGPIATVNRLEHSAFMLSRNSEDAPRQKPIHVDDKDILLSSACDEFLLRPFLHNDFVQARVLLRELPAIYPGGDAWLNRRLSDAIAGTARCTVAASPYGLVGITIETPKGYDRLKLSTLYIHPDFRRSGLGKRMLNTCRLAWMLAGIQQVHVTVDARRTSALAPLLVNAGFKYTTTELHRYGAGRHETVFHWYPSPHADTNDSHVNSLPIRRRDLQWHQAP